ncbi:PDZ domain-containing protein [Nostoc commune]|uniref:PDZ domain-containing protein n=1 Tax=Nostoc commune TaxID=1178 RepID=UPI0018C85591|nr:PDZ domain-containing protein [Nostoc commune]MBG1262741.1 PDZ domain-containing protein [Nostoc commune BAE]
MTVFTCASTDQSVTLLGEPKISGEAKVWQTNHNGYLAKIYHDQKPERMQKLAVMIAHRPKEPNFHLNHISFAWPKSVLKDAHGDCVGFLMPEIKEGKELIDIYNPQLRKRLELEVNWRFLHTTALNIASIIEAIHISGYVLGDIKPQNILVNDRALPSIIDTDSFQVRNPKNNKVYRCLVGSEGFTPPELIDKDFSSIDQTEVHDRFRLAVIIYQLLFSGQSPFGGTWIGAGEIPKMNELIRQGLWLYAPNNLIQPVDRTIPLEIVHPEVQRCFLRCFNDGYKNPNLRPTAEDWVKTLRLAVNELTICGKLDSHYYNRTYGKCYWCDRATKLHIDIFPGFARPKQVAFVESTLELKAFAVDKIIENLGIGGQIHTHSKQSIFQSSVYNSTSLSGNSLPAKTSTSNTIANNTPQQLRATKPIQNYAQVIIIGSVLASVTLGLLVFFAPGSPVPSSNNSNSAKDEQQELTQSELRETANSKIDRYIIGIGISFKLDEKTKIPAVTNVFEKSPAASGNLKVGDQILEVNGRSTSKMSAADVANLIQGDVNTAVFLLIRRLGFRDTEAMLIREDFINTNVDKDYVKRCSAYLQLKDYSKAVDDCSEAVKINPNNDEAYVLRCLSNFQLQDYSKAVDDCNEAVKINPNNDKAYFYRGASHIINGKKYQGIEDLRKAVSLGNEGAKEILKDVK